MELPFEIANEFLLLDPATGKLFWKNRSRKWFSSNAEFIRWNKRHAGSEAFTANNGRGYRGGKIFNRLYKAHRIVWLLHTGKWPSDQIDHINGIRDDNRPSNLRDVSALVNNRNRKRVKHAREDQSHVSEH